MAENTDFGALPDVLTELMKSPEIGNILSSLNSVTEPETKPAGDSGNFSLPPDFMEKLPAIMAALSGMGTGENKAPAPAQKSSGGQQRKALLKALRPYLNPGRQTVVDSLISLDSLTGLFSAQNGKKGDI